MIKGRSLINETIVLETAAGGALKRLSRIDPVAKRIGI